MKLLVDENNQDVSFTEGEIDSTVNTIVEMSLTDEEINQLNSGCIATLIDGQLNFQPTALTMQLQKENQDKVNSEEIDVLKAKINFDQSQGKAIDINDVVSILNKITL